MTAPDLNLLPALDALLSEGGVARAARKLGLSASAMSRALTRLRAATGDPLLVRAGRGLTLTPRAAELRERVRLVAESAASMLQPDGAALDVAALERTFTIRANDGFVEGLGAPLIAAAAAAAPGVKLRFAPKPDKDVRPLREGAIDLEIGVLGETGPEIRAQTLFHDRFVGVVRKGHPLLAAEISAERYAACSHVVTSRRGRMTGPVDEALAALGLERNVAVVVADFSAALAIAAESDLVALTPLSLIEARRRQFGSSQALESFALPVQTEAITVSQIWHPRLDADQGHRWLRRLVFETSRTRSRSAVSPAAEAIRGGESD